MCRLLRELEIKSIQGGEENLLGAVFPSSQTRGIRGNWVGNNRTQSQRGRTVQQAVNSKPKLNAINVARQNTSHAIAETNRMMSFTRWKVIAHLNVKGELSLPL